MLVRPVETIIYEIEKGDCRLRKEMEHIKIPDQCGSLFYTRNFMPGNTDAGFYARKRNACAEKGA